MSAAALTANPPALRSRLLVGSLVVVAMFRLATLGAYPLADTTESRYAEIARKMAESGDWITPWYDRGVPFWGKPPLHTWISALSLRAFGINEWAARLPHFLCAMLVAWLLWDWMRRERPAEALRATVLLAASALFFVASGAVMTEASLLVGSMLAMRGFWAGIRGAPARSDPQRWLLFIGLAVGLLAKGPVAAVLSMLPVLAWTAVTGRWRAVWQGIPWLRGLALTAALAAPWYVAAEGRTPGFLNYFVIGEHWQRFMVPGWQGDLYGNAHVAPIGSIWWFALVAFLPWSLLLPLLALGRRAHVRERAPVADRLWRGYLWAWCLAPCIFFTLSRNILWTYVMTGLPAMAMLAAGGLARDTRTQRTDTVVATGALVTCLVFAGLLAFQTAGGRFKSAKAVIEAVDARGDSLARLGFVGDRHFSAAFYSHGKARRIEPNVLQAWASADESEPESGIEFVALLNAQRDELPEATLANLQTQGRFGIYTLYARKPR